jgi:two-component system, chemotaxis family, chemotaxis protein CheY
MRCLIAEDEPTSCRILRHYMSKYGECDVATNGKEALELFKNALEAKQPYDVVCLDIMMPEMDGQDVLLAIRRIESERNIALGRGAKVIMTTSLDDAGNVVGAFRSGAESYLIKPIDQQKVAAAVAKLGLAAA